MNLFSFMNRLAETIDKIIFTIGRLASYSLIFLIVLVTVDVLLRYFLKFSRVWLTEIEVYLFAFNFIFGMAYALQKDKHVRVDVIYNMLSRKRRAWIDLIGGVIYLIPFSIVILILSWSYFTKSFSILERSTQSGGLPGLFVLKSFLFLGFGMLFLQGLSQIVKTIGVLINNRN